MNSENKEKAKRLLTEFTDLEKEIVCLKNQLSLREKEEAKTVKMRACLKEYEHRRDKEYEKILGALGEMPDYSLAKLLNDRYLCEKPMEEIAGGRQITLRHAYHLKQKALEMLGKELFK